MKSSIASLVSVVALLLVLVAPSLAANDYDYLRRLLSRASLKKEYDRRSYMDADFARAETGRESDNSGLHQRNKELDFLRDLVNLVEEERRFGKDGLTRDDEVEKKELEKVLDSLVSRDYKDGSSLSRSGRMQELNLNKRASWNLYSMSSHMLTESAWDYNDYGCYCGYRNRGLDVAPVDDVDNCCREHDLCYSRFDTSCPSWSGSWKYFYDYDWEYADTAEKKDAKCLDTNECKLELCTCDLEMNRCLQAATYDDQYYDWVKRELTTREEKCVAGSYQP